MSVVSSLRALVHRPYLRAAVIALSLVAAGCGIATVALEVRFGVPAHAVVRYFGRLHDATDDLTPLLRQPATLAVLDGLSYAAGGMNTGGLVYVDDGLLRFHPWMPADTATAGALRPEEREEIYSDLLPKYLAAELDELVAALSDIETRRRLGQLGVAPTAVEELRQRAAGELAPADRRSLLRQAGWFIRPFMPSGADRHRLGLADKLRFYTSQAPQGRYVGLYEVRGPRLLTAHGADPLPAVGRLLVITKEVDGSMTVDDLRPDRRHRYRLVPIDHPGDLPLFRITRA